jgi:hypothetical protein
VNVQFNLTYDALRRSCSQCLAVVVNTTTVMSSTQSDARKQAFPLPLCKDCVVKKAAPSQERTALPPPGKTVIVTSLARNKRSGEVEVTNIVVPHKYGFRTKDCKKDNCNGSDPTCVFSHPSDTIERGMWSLNDADYDKLAECLLMKADAHEIAKIKEVAGVSVNGVLEEEIGVVLRTPDETRKLGVIRLDRAPQGISGVYAFLEWKGEVKPGTRVVFGAVCGLVGTGSDLTGIDTLVPVATAVTPYDSLHPDVRNSPARPAKPAKGKDAAVGAAAEGTDKELVQFGTGTVSGTEVNVDIHKPFCVVTVGLQGAGKSHTQRVLLESCTMQTLHPALVEAPMRQPMSALVCHFEHHDRDVCEYAFIAEGKPGFKPPKVYVFTSPLNFAKRRNHYIEDTGLDVEVVPLKFHWPLANAHLRKVCTLPMR